MWIASLVCGVVALGLSWIPVFGAGLGVPIAFLGVGLGIGGVVDAKLSQAGASDQKRSLIALAVSLAGLVATIVFALVYR